MGQRARDIRPRGAGSEHSEFTWAGGKQRIGEKCLQFAAAQWMYTITLKQFESVRTNRRGDRVGDFVVPIPDVGDVGDLGPVEQAVRTTVAIARVVGRRTFTVQVDWDTEVVEDRVLTDRYGRRRVDPDANPGKSVAHNRVFGDSNGAGLVLDQNAIPSISKPSGSRRVGAHKVALDRGLTNVVDVDASAVVSDNRVARANSTNEGVGRSFQHRDATPPVLQLRAGDRRADDVVLDDVAVTATQDNAVASVSADDVWSSSSNDVVGRVD